MCFWLFYRGRRETSIRRETKTRHHRCIGVLLSQKTSGGYKINESSHGSEQRLKEAQVLLYISSTEAEIRSENVPRHHLYAVFPPEPPWSRSPIILIPPKIPGGSSGLCRNPVTSFTLSWCFCRSENSAVDRNRGSHVFSMWLLTMSCSSTTTGSEGRSSCRRPSPPARCNICTCTQTYTKSEPGGSGASGFNAGDERVYTSVDLCWATWRTYEEDEGKRQRKTAHSGRLHWRLPTPAVLFIISIRPPVLFISPSAFCLHASTWLRLHGWFFFLFFYVPFIFLLIYFCTHSHWHSLTHTRFRNENQSRRWSRRMKGRPSVTCMTEWLKEWRAKAVNLSVSPHRSRRQKPTLPRAAATSRLRRTATGIFAEMCSRAHYFDGIYGMAMTKGPAWELTRLMHKLLQSQVGRQPGWKGMKLMRSSVHGSAGNIEVGTAWTIWGDSSWSYLCFLTRSRRWDMG